MAEPRELPLFAWSEALRRDRARRRRFLRRGTLVALGSAALGVTIALPPSPRLVWNASASAPIGLYRVAPGAPVAAGDMVIAWLPPEARALAARRRYLPANVPLVKRVAAGPGAEVCAAGTAVFVDGRLAARRLAADRFGRPLPWWKGCRRLTADERFLLMADSAASFDGRYFGASRTSDIVGKAALLWPR